jgi:hypothetical protein
MFATWSLAEYWHNLVNGEPFSCAFTALVVVMLVGSTWLGWQSEEMSTEYEDNTDSSSE